MARLLTLALLAALTVAEVAAVLGLVDWLGPGGALLVLTADVLVGLLVMRWAVTSPQGSRGFRFAAGAVIALPGLVLNVVGVALLIPRVRDWARRRVLRTTETVLERSGISVVRVTTGDVIAGEVIDDPASASAAGPDGPAGWPPAADPSETGGPSATGGSGWTGGPRQPSGPGGTPKDRAGHSPEPGPRVIRGELESGQ